MLTELGHKNIEDIEVGDQVWAYNEETGENELKEVVHIFRNKTEEWVHVHINDEEITCTKNHPFYIPDLKQWINAAELELGMQVLLSNGDYGKISSLEVEHLDTPETTYNFEVKDLHNYYVGESNVLVHNDCAVDPYELMQTNGQNMSKKDFGKLIDDIKVNGIQDPVKYVDINGTKYIVDGNHRVAAAKILGMKTVPTQAVSLQYKGFSNIDDVLIASSEYFPNWRWR